MDDSIELRSEPMRRIVGKMPPALICYGIFALIGITGILFVLAYTLKFPSPSVLEGTILNEREIILYTSDRKDLEKVKAGAGFVLLNGGDRIYQGRLEEDATAVSVENGHYKIRIACLLPRQISQGGVCYLYSLGDRVTLEFKGEDIRLFHLLFQW